MVNDPPPYALEVMPTVEAALRLPFVAPLSCSALPKTPDAPRTIWSGAMLYPIPLREEPAEFSKSAVPPATLRGVVSSK